MGIIAGDTEGSYVLAATASWVSGNAKASGFPTATALSPDAASAVADACAIRCIASFARVGEEGWMCWSKNSSMSSFVSGSMCSTS